MIGEIIEYIIDAINEYFKEGNISESQVVPGNIAFIDAYQESSAITTTNKLIVSVVNISQESSLKNIPYRKSTGDKNGLPQILESKPEIWLNVFVLFGANRTDYISSLNYISKVISFFQKNQVFNPSDFDKICQENSPCIKKIIFDLYSMSFEELNQLWSIMGGKYIPSVLYKMRMILIQDTPESTQNLIDAIGAEPGIL